MVKADFKFPDGTTAKFEGTPDEIYSLTEKFQKNNVFTKGVKQKSSSLNGPQQRIRLLIEAGFFKQRKTLTDVKIKLEENGYIYTSNILSKPLLRLVKNKEIRRVKENGKWNYINL